MGYNAAPLEKLIEEFSKFPGIGRKGATRMAYQVLSMSDQDAAALAGAIQNAHTKLHRCRVCQNYTEAELCPICASAKTALSSVWWKRPVMCRRLSAPGSTMECTMCSTVSSAPWMASVPNS